MGASTTTNNSKSATPAGSSSSGNPTSKNTDNVSSSGVSTSGQPSKEQQDKEAQTKRETELKNLNQQYEKAQREANQANNAYNSAKRNSEAAVKAQEYAQQQLKDYNDRIEALGGFDNLSPEEQVTAKQQLADLNQSLQDANDVVKENTAALTALDTPKAKEDRQKAQDAADALKRKKEAEEDKQLQEGAALLKRAEKEYASLTDEEKKKVDYLRQLEENKKNRNKTGDAEDSAMADASNAALKAAQDDQADQENIQFSTDPVNNFTLPQWGYTNFVAELDNFRKGTTSLTGEPGWFYFKIFFNFTDTYGLLGSVLQPMQKESVKPGVASANINNNTAYNFLYKRQNAKWYVSSNIKARCAMLVRFINYLSYISSATPWFFDKVSGLDKAVVQTNDFTKEKSIEISCLEDAIDMRLTTLFHLYQYVCFDEVHQREILPENLRKFSMSIALYHVPIRLLHTNTKSSSGNDIAKSISGEGLNFSNRMSYKLFTFKGCEFDLNSLGTVVPSTLDNSKPFNLGKNTIKITYDRCYTHLMNEWEQIMLGPDGIYFDPNILQIKPGGDDGQNQRDRIAHIQNSITNSNNDKILSSIIGENFVKYASPKETLGNIYNLDIKKLQQATVQRNNSRVYLSNLYDYNPRMYRSIIMSENNNLNNIPINFGWVCGSVLEQHRRAWGRTAMLGPHGEGTSDFRNIYDLMMHAKIQLRNQYGTLYAYPDYRLSLKQITDSYVKEWNNIKGFWKSMVDTVNRQINSVKNMFKF